MQMFKEVKSCPCNACTVFKQKILQTVLYDVTVIHEIHVLELWMETDVYDPRSFQISVQA